MDRELSVVVYEGRVSARELASLSEALLCDPNYQKVRRQLADLRRCEGIAVETDELRDLARHVAATDRREGVRLAVVAPRDVMFGMARLYTAHREPSPMEVRVFRDMAEARAWLGLPEEPEG